MTLGPNLSQEKAQNLYLVIIFLTFQLCSDPAIQPTKPIANLQQRDESQFRKVPRGRYDTTYRREYLNFGNVSRRLFFASTLRSIPLCLVAFPFFPKFFYFFILIF